MATLFTCALAARPAQAEVVEDAALWFGTSWKGVAKAAGVETPWHWSLMGQGRLRDDSSGFNQTIVGPKLGYAGRGPMTYSIAYNWLRTWVPGPTDHFDEHRIVQSVAGTHQTSRIRWTGATQLEERFFSHVDGAAVRWRLLLGGRMPIPETNTGLIVRDEVFVNLNDRSSVVATGLDQNRFFTGFDISLDRTNRRSLELGYLNQYIETTTSAHVMVHALSMNVGLSF